MNAKETLLKLAFIMVPLTPVYAASIAVTTAIDVVADDGLCSLDKLMNIAGEGIPEYFLEYVRCRGWFGF